LNHFHWQLHGQLIFGIEPKICWLGIITEKSEITVFS